MLIPPYKFIKGNNCSALFFPPQIVTAVTNIQFSSSFFEHPMFLEIIGVRQETENYRLLSSQGRWHSQDQVIYMKSRQEERLVQFTY